MRLGCRARGWRKKFRPTIHLSMTRRDQRNAATDRLVTKEGSFPAPHVTLPVSFPRRRSCAPAILALQAHAQDWSEMPVCSPQSGAPARPGQTQLESIKVQRSSATRSLLERRTRPEWQSCAKPYSQDGYARRHSASTAPWFAPLAGRPVPRPGVRHYIPRPGSRELPRIPLSGVFC